MFPQPGHRGPARPPPPGSPLLPYNEDTIVSLILQIFSIFIALDYIPAEEIAFPPTDTGRHQLNATICEQLHLAPQVQSLLQRLPYLQSRWEIPVYIDSLSINYLDDTELLESRDPHSPLWPNDGPRCRPRARDYMRPADVALNRPRDREGHTWILDTEANTIRTLHAYDDVLTFQERCVSYVAELPSDPTHYRNCPAYPAEAVLNQYIEQLRSLEIFAANKPVGHFLFHGWDYLLPNEASQIVRRRLIHEYGWPDQFRQADWAADREGVWELADETGEEGHLQRRLREVQELLLSGRVR